jgi:hypothetical protein
MKPFNPFIIAVLGLAIATPEIHARGDRELRIGGKGRSASPGRATAAPARGGASVPRSPVTGSKIQRPAARPAPQPAARPQARPTPAPRPETRPAPRPESRPAPRPESRPSPPVKRPSVERPSLERPTTRPAPGNRPETRPGIPDKRPETKPNLPEPRPNLPETRPSLPENRPGNNTRPGERPGNNLPDLRPGERPGGNNDRFPNRPGAGDGDRPQFNRPGGNRPTTLPGMISYPDKAGNKRPNIGSIGKDKINIGDRNKIHIDNINVGRINKGLNRPSTLPARVPNWDTGKWGGNKSIWGNKVNIGNDVNININNNFRHSVNYSYRPNYWGARPWWGAGHCHTWHHGHWGYGYNRHHYHHCWWHDDDDDFAEGFMWGIAAWSLGNMIFDMGYQTYRNPYPAPPVQNTTIVYTQPLSVSAAKAPPGDDATATTAETKSSEALERSRTAFKKGDYVTAMSTVDEALSYMPGDVTLHEYRALVLFALGKYAESAGVLNPVLASGPGWGWDTMVGFYDSSSTYTEQLRRLEEYVKGKPDAAEGHFVLGYHYLVTDHMDQAYTEFETTAKLQPADGTARQLRDLAKSSLPDDGEVDAAPVERPAPVDSDKLVGSWVSDRGQDGKVTFSMAADGNYTWSFMNGDQKSELKGTYGLNEKGLLVLTGEDSQMISEVTLTGDKDMKFVLIGAPEGDPGLEFKKS